jgi:hypothetical protein
MRKDEPKQGETEKRPYVEPKLEKRQQLAEITEGVDTVSGVG